MNLFATLQKWIALRHFPNGVRPANGNRQVRELRVLSRPLWVMLTISAASLLAFVAFLSITMDRNAIRSSQAILQSVLKERTQNLSKLNLEYGYWDEMVENTVDTLDKPWVEDHMQDYMYADLNVFGVHIFDSANRSKLNLVTGKFRKSDPTMRYGDPLAGLIASARKTVKDKPPVPVTGMIGTAAKPYLASAVLMTTYNQEADVSTDHVLVFTRPLNRRALKSIEETYHLWGLSVSQIPPGLFEAGVPLTTAGGEVLGHFVWKPELVALRMLPWIAMVLGMIATAMIINARIFLTRAASTVSALELAREQAEKAKQLLHQQAITDPLTGLGNRRSFDEQMAALNGDRSKIEPVALIAIDLDRFKQVNDVFGHDTGDGLLVHVAEGLKQAAGELGTAFRLGGDEFAILCEASDKDAIIELGERIVRKLTLPISINNNMCRIGASVGISFSGDPNTIPREADQALYAAKHAGRGQVMVFDPELSDPFSVNDTAA